MARLALDGRSGTRSDWFSQRATELAPNDAEPWWRRARVLKRANRLSEAIEMMERAPNLALTNARLWMEKRELLDQAGQTNGAVASYTRAKELAGGDEELKNEALRRQSQLLERSDKDE